MALLCLVLQCKTSLLWAPDLVPARSAECRPKAWKAERPFGSGGPVTVSPASVSQCSRSLGLVAARRGSPGPLYVPTPLSRSRPFRIGFRGAYVPFRFGGLFSTSQGRSGLPRGERLSSSHWFPPSSLAGAGSFWAAVTSVTKILAPFGRVNLTFPGQK